MKDTYKVKTVYCTGEQTSEVEHSYGNGDRAAAMFSFRQQQGAEKKQFTVGPRKDPAHIAKVLLLLQSSEQLENEKVVEAMEFDCGHDHG